VRLTGVGTAIFFSGLSAAASTFYVDAQKGSNAGSQLQRTATRPEAY